jgi:hypothetical protein
MKSIPIESQGFVGIGSVCSLPAGFLFEPFDHWQASQVLQNSVTSD